MLTIGGLVVESLDYLFIVDKNYRIVYNTRYDGRLNNESSAYSVTEIKNKNFFEVYPNLSKEDSSIARCIETGEIVISKNQVIYDYLNRRYVTNNVTFPIIRKGELMAAVELSMDVDEDEKEGDFAGVNKKFDDFVYKLKKDAGHITFDKIMTNNQQMKMSIEKAKMLATLPNHTLIYGETGTGKELFAQSMIAYSEVPQNKVVIQNCAAVPENLMESILFGTVKGAYTGAENRKGLFEQADGGVLFLDELNSIPFVVQSKLLRVLQDGSFRPLGSNKDKHVNVKVIAAMNIDPVEAMENNIIRSDLFYRLSGGLISLLPLRDRKEDIQLFTDYYLRTFSAMYNKNVTSINDTAKRFFMEYPWPGNVRELRNTVESMVVSLKEGSVVTEAEIPIYIMDRMKKQYGIADIEADSEDEEASKNCGSDSEKIEISIDDSQEFINYHEIMETVERQLIEEAVRKSGGNVKEAGRILGIPRETLRYRIKKLGISGKDFT